MYGYLTLPNPEHFAFWLEQDVPLLFGGSLDVCLVLMTYIIDSIRLSNSLSHKGVESYELQKFC